LHRHRQQVLVNWRASKQRLAVLRDGDGVVHYVLPRNEQSTKPVMVCQAGPTTVAGIHIVCTLPDEAATCLWCATLQTRYP
jgi:hypothetical protein